MLLFVCPFPGLFLFGQLIQGSCNISKTPDKGSVEVGCRSLGRNVCLWQFWELASPWCLKFWWGPCVSSPFQGLPPGNQWRRPPRHISLVWGRGHASAKWKPTGKTGTSTSQSQPVTTSTPSNPVILLAPADLSCSRPWLLVPGQYQATITGTRPQLLAPGYNYWH